MYRISELKRFKLSTIVLFGTDPLALVGYIGYRKKKL
jgi:hypothetical protein